MGYIRVGRGNSINELIDCIKHLEDVTGTKVHFDGKYSINDTYIEFHIKANIKCKPMGNYKKG